MGQAGNNRARCRSRCGKSLNQAIASTTRPRRPITARWRVGARYVASGTLALRARRPCAADEIAASQYFLYLHKYKYMYNYKSPYFPGEPLLTWLPRPPCARSLAKPTFCVARSASMICRPVLGGRHAQRCYREICCGTRAASATPSRGDKGRQHQQTMRRFDFPSYSRFLRAEKCPNCCCAPAMRCSDKSRKVPRPT
jgi:hypothetical protein